MLCIKCKQNRAINEELYFFEGEGGPLPLNFNLNYYCSTYKYVVFQISAKSHHEEFDFFEEGEGGGGTPKIAPKMKNLDFFEGGEERGPLSLNFNLNYYWSTYKYVVFQISAKSHHEEFDFFEEGEGGTPISKF